MWIRNSSAGMIHSKLKQFNLTYCFPTNNKKDEVYIFFFLLNKLLITASFSWKYLYFQRIGRLLSLIRFILRVHHVLKIPLGFQSGSVGNRTAKLPRPVNSSSVNFMISNDLWRPTRRLQFCSLCFGFSVFYCDSFSTQSNLINKINDVLGLPDEFSNLNKHFHSCATQEIDRLSLINPPPPFCLSLSLSLSLSPPAPVHSLRSSVQIKCLKDVFKKSLRGQTQLFWAPHRSRVAPNTLWKPGESERLPPITTTYYHVNPWPLGVSQGSRAREKRGERSSAAGN